MENITHLEKLNFIINGKKIKDKENQKIYNRK